MNTGCSIYLAGPTAVGKTDFAVLLAETLNGEIICVDSMTVYRALNIGTAKPSPQQRARITHHLVDVAELNQEFDAAQFCSRAEKAEHEIRSRGKIPIFCGGTGLYFKTYIHGLDPTPIRQIERRLELETWDLARLVARLKNLDPRAALTIDLHNPRRVIRAVEIVESNKRPLDESRLFWGHAAPLRRGLFYFLNRSREDLVPRIESRVEEMFKLGLVGETRSLIEQGLLQNRTACQAIGYRQVIEHLQGKLSLPAAIDLVKIKTRQYAKRQVTWFKTQIGIQQIDAMPGDSSKMILERMRKLVEKPPFIHPL